MKMMIVHLSDIHLSDQKDQNPVLGRVEKITAAVSSLFVNEAKLCLVLVSGDITFSGQTEQYLRATELFTSLTSSLQAQFPSGRVQCLFVPGNHDCDFSRDDEVRQSLLSSLDAATLKSDSIIRTLTSVQDNFFEFCTMCKGEKVTPIGMNRLLVKSTILVDGVTVHCNLINSAWMSSLREIQGTLQFPFQYLSLESQAAPSIVISAIHHPYNWFRSESGRRLRFELEQSSDFIFTGHEHEPDTYSKTGSHGEHNEYTEGGVLQESSNAAAGSTFSVIVVDTDTRTQKTHSFVWQGDLYSEEGDSPERPFIRNKARLKHEFDPSPALTTFLDDPDTVFTHPRKDPILLSDVFLYPDIRPEDKKSTTETARIVHSSDVVSYILEKKKVILAGADRAGKTAMAKMLFADLRRNGKIPLILNTKDFTKKQLKTPGTIFIAVVQQQYSAAVTTKYWQLDRDTRAVIVDDYHGLPISKTIRDAFIAELLKRFGIIVLCGGYELRLQEMLSPDHLLWDFQTVEIMPFGHRLRSEFIKRWHRIGADSLIEDDSVLINNVIRLEKTVSLILGRDLLPSYPIYLLLLLQQIETAIALDTATASFGHLYKAVITNLLSKTSDRIDLDARLNYLSELAYHWFSSRTDHFEDAAALVWHNDYCARYAYAMDFSALRDGFTRAGILVYTNGQVRFRYPAMFYYFTASYIANHLSEYTIRDQLSSLCGKLYSQDAANIVLFVCHVSKDSLIIDSVLHAANSLFGNLSLANIQSDIEGVFVLPSAMRLVMDDGDPEGHRQKMLSRRDLVEIQDDVTDEMYAYRREEELAEESAIRRQLAHVNASVKTIQIVGQILQNFAGSLLGSAKSDLTVACYTLGLRLMKFFFDVVKDTREDMLSGLKEFFKQTHSMGDAEALQRANCFFFGLVEAATFGIVKRISGAVGFEGLRETFSEVLSRNPSFETRIIDLSIKLDHYTNIPIEETLTIYGDASKSFLAKSLVAHLVYYRLYYFQAPYNVRQSLCQKMGIKLLPRMLDPDPKLPTG